MTGSVYNSLWPHAMISTDIRAEATLPMNFLLFRSSSFGNRSRYCAGTWSGLWTLWKAKYRKRGPWLVLCSSIILAAWSAKRNWEQNMQGGSSNLSHVVCKVCLERKRCCMHTQDLHLGLGGGGLRPPKMWLFAYKFPISEPSTPQEWSKMEHFPHIEEFLPLFFQKLQFLVLCDNKPSFPGHAPVLV